MPGSNIPLSIKFLRDSARENPPSQATPGSAGLDLRAALDTPTLTIAPGQRVAVPTGIAIEIGRPGIAGFVFSRSGLGAKHGLTVAQGVGVIDPDYRGEIVVWLLNTSQEPRTIQANERIAQLVLLHVFSPVISVVEELGDTARGAGGFGHTGKV
jgi:dUTP pyrophosphatase